MLSELLGCGRSPTWVVLLLARVLPRLLVVHWLTLTGRGCGGLSPRLTAGHTLARCVDALASTGTAVLLSETLLWRRLPRGRLTESLLAKSLHTRTLRARSRLAGDLLPIALLPEPLRRRLAERGLTGLTESLLARLAKALRAGCLLPEALLCGLPESLLTETGLSESLLRHSLLATREVWLLSESGLSGSLEPALRGSAVGRVDRLSRTALVPGSCRIRRVHRIGRVRRVRGVDRRLRGESLWLSKSLLLRREELSLRLLLWRLRRAIAGLLPRQGAWLSERRGGLRTLRRLRRERLAGVARLSGSRVTAGLLTVTARLVVAEGSGHP